MGNKFKSIGEMYEAFAEFQEEREAIGDYDMGNIVNDFCNIYANSYEEYNSMWALLEESVYG